MEAQKKRIISTSTQYDQYIKKADNKTHIIKADAGIPDTVKLMKSVILESVPQAKSLAQVLRGGNLYDTCRNIWNFFYDNVQYTRDEQGKEQVRTFNRMYFDRLKGVDCDCYTVSICALLINLGIESFVRVAAYNEKTGFQHVYVVVEDETQPKGYIVIDPVMEKFDAEHPFILKEDYKIRANYQDLRGLETEKNINFTTMDRYLNTSQQSADAQEMNGIFDSLISSGASLIPGGSAILNIAGGPSGILNTITGSLSQVGSMIGIGKNAAGKAEAQAATQKVKDEVVRLKATLPGEFAQAQAAVNAAKQGYDNELATLRATLTSI